MKYVVVNNFVFQRDIACETQFDCCSAQLPASFILSNGSQ